MQLQAVGSTGEHLVFMHDLPTFARMLLLKNKTLSACDFLQPLANRTECCVPGTEVLSAAVAHEEIFMIHVGQVHGSRSLINLS